MPSSQVPDRAKRRQGLQPVPADIPAPALPALPAASALRALAWPRQRERAAVCLPANSRSQWFPLAYDGLRHRNHPHSLWPGWIGPGKKDESLGSKHGNREYYSAGFCFSSTCTTLPLIFTAKILCSPTSSQSATPERATLKRLAGPWRTPLPLVPIMARGV